MLVRYNVINGCLILTHHAHAAAARTSRRATAARGGNWRCGCRQTYGIAARSPRRTLQPRRDRPTDPRRPPPRRPGRIAGPWRSPSGARIIGQCSIADRQPARSGEARQASARGGNDGHRRPVARRRGKAANHPGLAEFTLPMPGPVRRQQVGVGEIHGNDPVAGQAGGIPPAIGTRLDERPVVGAGEPREPDQRHQPIA